MSALEDFVTDAFPDTISGKIFVCSIINGRGGHEKKLATRDPARVVEFARHWDLAGRGCFYCVSTVRGSRRSKEDAQETLMLHVDVDLKDLEVDASYVLGLLDRLDRPPSRVHHSGHGLHALWLLDRPAPAGERTEAVLRKLARALAGDQSVAQSASLMRLPGTHNSKNGDWVEVQVLRRTDRRYSLEEMEQWDVPVVLLKRGTEVQNPFLRVAEEQGFRPAMDVERALREMTTGNIHNTQLSAIASLLSAGVPKAEAVAKVLAATRVAVGDVAWNWVREERGIRKMADDWEAKMGDEKKEASTGNVVRLADARKPPKADGKKAHVVLARGVLAELSAAGESILFTGTQMWRYQGRRWRPVPGQEEKDWLDRAVERGCQVLGLVSKNSLVNETTRWLRRQPDLHREEVPWDAHGRVATRSGLLDVDTGQVEPHRADHWTTRWLECDYDPEARCPWWLRMLQDALADDRVVQLVQEVVGSLLVEGRSRTFRRALVFFGASNTGKSTIIAVIAGFLSREMNTTPLEMLENAHGLMRFLSSDPWVLHEAFEQGRWEFSAHAKALLSADPISVNVKNGPLVAHVFKQPILWGTNTPPQFRESTKAMQNRLITIPCSREFGSEPTGAAEESTRRGFSSPAEMVLATERDGILAWAVEGWRRLKARGHFLLPEGVAEAMHDMWLQSNLVAGFVEECVEYDLTSMVSTQDFCGAFKIWWEENRGDQRAPASQAIGMALQSLGDRRICTSRLLKDRMRRYYGGIKLNERGLDCWQGFSASRSAVDSGSRISTSASDVNKLAEGHFLDVIDPPTTWRQPPEAPPEVGASTSVAPRRRSSRGGRQN